MKAKTIASLLAVSLVSGVMAAEVSCWAPDGETIADNTTYVPCNKLGIEQEGVFSSCCRLDGKANERDLCGANGLCLRDGVYSRGYCTDKTWNSPACVNVCTSEDEGGSVNGTVPITACNDGTYCCGLNNLRCCDTDKAFPIPTQASVVGTNVTETAVVTETATPSTYKNATIGIGAALGVVALVALGAILWLWRQNKKLRQQLAEKSQAETTPLSQLSQPYQPTVSAVSPRASEHGLGKLPFAMSPGSPRPSEIQGESRYSELDGFSNTLAPTSPPAHQTDFDHSPRGSPLPSPRPYQ